MHPQSPIVIELVRVAAQRSPKRYSVPAHLHHYHQIDIVLDGEFAVSLEDRRPLVLRRGDALLTPPLVRHAYHADTPVRHAVFKCHIAPGFWPMFGSKPRRVRLSDSVLAATRDWADVAERQPDNEWGPATTRSKSAPKPSSAPITWPPTRFTSPNAPPLWAQWTAATATLCLVQFARRGGERDDGAASPTSSSDELDLFRQQLWQMLERIGTDPYKPWSIADLARELHLSTPHFSRCFLKVVGETPKHYLLSARMRAAAAELVSPEHRPIKQISNRAGYTTVHAFTHAFKNFFGQSPGAYRSSRVKM